MNLVSILAVNTDAFQAVCAGDGKVIMDFVANILIVIQIVVPILLIVFGSVDLAKAVMAGKDDEIKKAQMTFVKRLIPAVIVFFIPFVVNLVLGLVPVGEDGNGNAITWGECKNGVRNTQ